MTELSAFVREWLEATNPWRATLYDGDHELELRTMFFFVCFVSLHVAMTRLKERGLLHPVLASRPTFVANNCHCCVVAPLALWSLVRNGLLLDRERTFEDYALWRRFGVPYSVAYLCGDVVWYCLPSSVSPLSSSRRCDWLMLVHHLVMIACHYPTGSTAGAVLCGAGDPLWSVETSCLGYLCELSNPLMNYRWWLTRTLREHRADFSVVAVALVISMASRVVLLLGAVTSRVAPRFEEFCAAKQVVVYATCVVGHVVVAALSAYWTRVLTAGGWRRATVFSPSARTTTTRTDGGFVFGTDMGRSTSSSTADKKSV